MKEEYIIGRLGDIEIDEDSVSRQHASLLRDETGIYLKDLGSSNGTYLVKNGEKELFSKGYITTDQDLAFGDAIISVNELLALVDSISTASRVHQEAGRVVIPEHKKNSRARPLHLESQSVRLTRCTHCGSVVSIGEKVCPFCKGSLF